MLSSYINDTEEAKSRILAAIPDHPEILEIKDPFDLFGIPGLNFDGLELSLFQAEFAMKKAQAEYQSANRNL